MVFGFGTKSFLGVDIGTNSIKTVELVTEKRRVKLKNYGEYIPPSSKRELLPVETGFAPYFEEGIANIIKKIVDQAKIKTKNLILSLPVFSSFFTLVELPLMDPKEIPEAIKFQAYQYIPVPIEEVVLNWMIIREREAFIEDKVQVLLVAVPNDVIEKYMRIARILGLKLVALELESFAEARALAREGGPITIVNIGGRTTNVTIVDNGFIRLCNNLNFSAFNLTDVLSKKMGINSERAKELQKTKGLKREADSLIAPILAPVIDKIIFGVKKAINSYLSKSPQKKIQKIVLSGGVANMPGLIDYLSSKLSFKIERADPFSEILYPPVLHDTLEAIGPSFSVAVGLALREFVEKK